MSAQQDEPTRSAEPQIFSSALAEALWHLHQQNPTVCLRNACIVRLDEMPSEMDVRNVVAVMREEHAGSIARIVRLSGQLHKERESWVPVISYADSMAATGLVDLLERASSHDFVVAVTELDAYGPVAGILAPAWVLDSTSLDAWTLDLRERLSNGKASHVSAPQKTVPTAADTNVEPATLQHPALELPFDRPRSKGGLAETYAQRVSLDDPGEGSRASASDIATAFAALCARYSGQDAFHVGILERRKSVGTEMGQLTELRFASISSSPQTSYADMRSCVEMPLRGEGPVFGISEESRTSSKGPDAHDIRASTPVRAALYVKRKRSELFIMELEGEISTTSVFDLEVRAQLDDTEHISELTLRVAKDLFERESAKQLAGHLALLIQRVVKARTESLSGADAKVWGEPLLTDVERDYWLNDFNNSDAQIEDKLLVHEIIEATVESSPQRLAIKDDVGEWTYETLNNNANRVGHALVKAGVEENVRVGIFSERHAEFLASVLGVFKAGGAFVPIDPNYPAERITRILQISEAQVIIHDTKSGPALKAALATLDSPPQCTLLDVNDLIHNGPVTNIQRRCGPDSLAYIIFTSGSTGLPKGAMVEQKGMRNHLYAKAIDLGFDVEDRILQNASQCFDISVFQYLIAGLFGGMVRVVSNETALDPRQLLDVVVEDRISVLEMVPSLGRAMISYKSCVERLRSKHSLRWLILTGEAIPPALVGDWFAVAPDIPIMNAYGPTECSDDVSHEILTTALPPHIANTPVGRPIINMRLYVIDRGGHIAPVGVHGELWITGIGVGRGYLNDKKRTDLAFVPNTIDGQSQRAYKTGDRIRLLHSGTLEFLGRIDHQVKIRGYRIELGEIESALLRHPEVSESVVVGLEDDEGAKTLVGYFVAPTSIDISALKQHLGTMLPHYMIPTVLMRLDVMPLSPNGKIQRSALPPPTFAESTETFASPEGAVERKLEQIWSVLLKQHRVSATSNFFGLGGDSLMAIRMFAQIQEVFGMNLQIARLFESPTIRELASVIERKRNEPEHSGSVFSEGKSVVPIRITGRGSPFFCIHGGGGNVLNFYHLAKLLPLEIDFYGIQAVGVDGRRPPLTSIEDMADHYMEAIRAEADPENIILGGFSGGGLVALLIAQRLRRQGIEPKAVVLLDTYCPHVEAIESTMSDKFAKFQKSGFAYVKERAAQISEQKWTALELWRHELFGKALPHKLRERKLFDAFERAESKFICTPYDGYTILVRAEEISDEMKHIGISLGWDKYLSNLQVVSTPGDHESMVTEPNVHTLADVLYSELRKILG